MKTKNIFFLLQPKYAFKEAYGCGTTKETCPHLKVSTNILSANVVLFTAPLFVCMVIVIMLSEVLKQQQHIDFKQGVICGGFFPVIFTVTLAP